MVDDSDAAWSRRGEAVTAFEAGLVARVDAAALGDAARLWLELARAMGCEALLRLLDEVGGEKVHVPTRRSFFDALWRPLRDDAMRRAAAQGYSAAEIAPRFGVSLRRALHVLSLAEDRTTRRENSGRRRRYDSPPTPEAPGRIRCTSGAQRRAPRPTRKAPPHRG